jgi:hypothetical protein
VRFASVGELHDAECAAFRVQTQRSLVAARKGDGLVLDVDALLDPSIVAPCLGRRGLGGGDAVDREQSEFAEQVLVETPRRAVS